MKTRIFAFTSLATLVGVFALSAGALGARPPDAGKGGGGAGNAPPDYGDLIILYRDAYGVPIPSAEVQVEDPETGDMVDGGMCLQPIAFPSNELCDLECGTADPCLVPVDQLNCAIEPAYAGCTQEVDFGRVNEARSPDAVFESQLEEVVVSLATADCVTLDPAGRLVTTRVIDGEVLTSAIDSPLQNLAIYRELMLTGTLGASLPEGAGTLDTAARGLGAASDKAGEVDLDLVAYLNQIMGLSDPATPTILDKRCETYREEVQGVVQLVEKCFLDYGAYGYNREDNFMSLPSPPYIPEGAPKDGTFEYLSLVADTDPPLFEILYGLILDAVFPDGTDGFVPFDDDNIRGFVQAADDARAVISFMHENEVPVDFVTSLLCLPSAGISYDVSLSDESGLQVPRVMVDGTEGREFTVSITNDGPDPATGTVIVTATAAAGGAIDGSPWIFDFEDLAASASDSGTAFFSINLGGETTIAWTATVYAKDDVNLGNNKATEATVVKVTDSGVGGGGGHGGRH